MVIEDASTADEQRSAAIGLTEDWRMLLVVHIEQADDSVRIISARLATPESGGDMRTGKERMKVRLSKERKMVTISIRMPEDVIDDLKEIAPMLGFSGYQPLIKAYVGQGMRQHIQDLEASQLPALEKSLRAKGVSARVISSAMAEAKLKSA